MVPNSSDGIGINEALKNLVDPREYSGKRLTNVDDSQYFYKDKTRDDSDDGFDEDGRELPMGIPFKRTNDGKIRLMVDQVFRDANHFKKILLSY